MFSVSLAGPRQKASSLAGKLMKYRKAVDAAIAIHGLSLPRAVASVAMAKAFCGIGPEFHALFGLASVPVRRWKGYSRPEAFEALLREANPNASRRLVANKLEFDGHCRAHGIPTIPTVALVHGEATADELGRERCFRRWQQQVENWEADALFFKKVSGAHGEGAFLAERSNGSWNCGGRQTTLPELFGDCLETPGGFLVQPRVADHPAIRRLTGSSTLSTLRLVSVRRNSHVEVPYALLKLAAGGGLTDHFDLGRSGNLIAAVDAVSGRLWPAVGSRDSEFTAMERFRENPRTGDLIEGSAIPYWTEAIALVIKAHATVPELKTLGWDIAITDSGPLVVEANTNYGPEIIEVAFGRGIQAEVAEMLGQKAPRSGSK
jgi:hypothetical protein